MTSVLEIRRRRRSRGAAAVEALIVCGLLMTCLAGVLFFHRLYAAKLFTIREARRDLWNQALPGCNGAVVGEVINLVRASWDLGENICSVGADGTCETGSVMGFSMGYDSQGPNWAAPGERNGAADRAVNGSYKITWSGTAHTDNTAACNEQPQDGTRGTMVDVIGYAIDLFVPFDI